MNVRSLTSRMDLEAIPIWPVGAAELVDWCAARSTGVKTWIQQSHFKAEACESLLIPGDKGQLIGVVLGTGESRDFWIYGDLARKLPPRTYRIEAKLDTKAATHAALAWALGDYEFSRYRKTMKDESNAILAIPTTANAEAVQYAYDGTVLVRDLVNTPAEDMGPGELADVVESLAHKHGAITRVISGDELLDANFPAIHSVGRASARDPCLVDMTWGDPSAPRVTLVGKGVCFDSGGLDLKTSSGMKLMKKDMGGAATIIGLASMIMSAKLPVRLRVLIPAVENSVAGNALRPGDVIATRKGLTIEIGNTDAEGRVILADALALGDEEKPDILIDCATLTGAARSALGPDIPAFYTPEDDLSAALSASSHEEEDPLWRMPLWSPYHEFIDSKIADINNAGESPFAGSITAALFLQDFVTETSQWLHLDLFAWNHKARPGRPVGGEAMGMRALFGLLANRYG